MLKFMECNVNQVSAILPEAHKASTILFGKFPWLDFSSSHGNDPSRAATLKSVRKWNQTSRRNPSNIVSGSVIDGDRTSIRGPDWTVIPVWHSLVVGQGLCDWGLSWAPEATGQPWLQKECGFRRKENRYRTLARMARSVSMMIAYSGCLSSSVRCFIIFITINLLSLSFGLCDVSLYRRHELFNHIVFELTNVKRA